MKIHYVGADASHADGRTDMTKLIAAFLNFAKKPKSVRVNPATEVRTRIDLEKMRFNIYTPPRTLICCAEQ